MSNCAAKRESLNERAKRWGAAMAASDTGPLVVAAEVVALANEWDHYKDEVDGLGITPWLKKTLGKGRGLAWFEVRARAVEKLGEASRRTLHHEVAVWLIRSVPETKWKECVTSLMFARKRNGGNALTEAMARPIVRVILGKPARPEKIGCERCAALEALLKKNGIEVEE